jgi:hypothetical protein
MSKKEIKKTPSGTIYFEVDTNEMVSKLKGLGICDSCSKAMFNGFLVPVLGYVQCEKCFKKSGIQDNYYEEDRHYEETNTKRFLQVLESE